MHEGAVKSFEALSTNLVNSGSSLQAIADRRTASVKKRAMLVFNRRLIIRDFIRPIDRQNSTEITPVQRP